MRSLSSTLKSAQQGFGELLVKLVLTSGSNLYAYTNETDDVIQYLKEQESSASQQAQVTISNFNNNLSALTLEGYGAVVSFGYRTGVSRSAWAVGTAYAIDDIVVPTAANGYQYRCKVAGTSHAATEPTWPTSLGDTVADNTVTWEMDGNSGDEYSRCPAFVVKGQELSHAPANLSCALHLYGLPDQLDQDEASAAYAPDTTNTDTVKTIFNAIAGATLAAYNHCTAVTVVWDSEDSLVDTFQPKDLLRIAVGDSRLAKLKWLLAWTKCVMRFENDGKIHVFAPTTAPATTTETLRPNGAGDETTIQSADPDVAHYLNVDEAVADDDDTIIYDRQSPTTYYRDLFALPSSAVNQGAITQVAVYARARAAGVAPEQASLKIACKTKGTVYEGDAETMAVDLAYANFSKTWTTNPNTGLAWAWEDINDLQIGVAMRSCYTASPIFTICTQVYAVVTYTPVDYQYSLDIGHPFFTKIYRRPLVLPNRVSIASNPGDSPSYSGESTSAASYTLLPKSEFKNMTLASDAQAAAIAAAMIQNYEQDAEKGQGFVPMNVGQEVYDYVFIIDSVENDSREGNVGYLTRIFDLNNKRYPYTMSFGFGRVPVGSLIGTGAIGGAGGVAGSGPVTYSDFLSVVNDIYENFNDLLDYMDKRTREINIVDDSVPDTLDDLADGTTYNKVLATHINAGGISVSSLTTYAASYDPSQKRRNFTAEPTTPYDVGDLWHAAGTVKRCSTARASGAYVAGDWTAISLDDVADGSTYGRLTLTDIQAGHIKLTTSTVWSGKVQVLSGVTIDSAAGINLFGANNALTTRATEAGTIQCSVNSSGQITAGAGAVLLDASGITIDASVGSTVANFKGSAAKFLTGSTLVGTIAAISGSWIFTAEANQSITLVPGSGEAVEISGAATLAGVIEPTTDLGQSLGEPTKRWDYLYARYLGHASYPLSTGYIDTLTISTALAGGVGATWNFSGGAWLCLPRMTADPVTPADGYAWYRTDTDEYRCQVNGTVKKFTTEAV